MIFFQSLFSKGAPEEKASAARTFVAMNNPGAPAWTPRNYQALARNGYERNVIAYRCVRLIAEAAASAPLGVRENGRVLSDHPLLDLLATPNSAQAGADLLGEFYGFLQTAGNAYLEAALIDGAPRELYALRPDRIKVRPGADGWPVAWEYAAGTRKTVLAKRDGEIAPVLHLKLFHPTNDHYGLSPMEAAQTSIDLHNGASAWNKALLDNAARPSGALVYRGPDGAENLTADQFDRLKSELADAYQGSAHAGRPLVLDGGLEWRSMSLSPAEMDFLEAKNTAAREIALAFGVPPMLLGIPGDNTYANYREANLAFWKQTVTTLVKKTAASLTNWFRPVYPDAQVYCDTTQIDALASERDARWDRVNKANFLSDVEKRRLLGLADSEEGTR